MERVQHVVRWRVRSILGTLVTIVVAIVVVRALSVSSRQVSVQPAAQLDFDGNAAVHRLGEALRFKTVSRDGMLSAENDYAKFAVWLTQAYPKLHRALSRETVGQGSLLYTWQGSQADLPALLLLSHIDVVPVERGTEPSWTYPPFGGVIADNHVWGRGALDDKGSLIAILEAAEQLVAVGFRPTRTVYFAFGHDEETGGRSGAQAIARLLASRGVAIDALLDEGGVIAEGIVPGVAAPIALVGIAEKGYVNVELRSGDLKAGQGGHSSMPPPMTHIGRLARALDRIQQHPFPADLRGPAQEMLEHLAAEMSPALRTVAANLWLFEPLLVWQARNSSSLNALLRTTAAPTLIWGGVKDNVVPSSASAVVNFRLLPGDSVRDVLDHVREVVDDSSLQIAVRGNTAEASRVTSSAAPQFTQLSQIIRSIYPDVLVAPYLVLAATDARHYGTLTRNSYRFVPVRLSARDLRRIHGADERLAISDFLDCVRFYRALIEHWTR